jgi:hypothetical protein
VETDPKSHDRVVDSTLMSEYDLKKVDKADVKLNKYVTMLQVKYGYTRQQAKTEIDKRVAEFEA